MIEKDASKLESGSQLNDAGGGGHTSKVEKKIFNYEGVDGHQGSGGVQRVLKARQLQMIALGGTIGTGKSQSSASKLKGTNSHFRLRKVSSSVLAELWPTQAQSDAGSATSSCLESSGR